MSRLSSNIPASSFSPEDIDKSAKLALSSGGFVQLPIVKESNDSTPITPKYEVIGNHFAYHVAARMKEIDPRKGEQAVVFKVNDDNESAIETQLKAKKYFKPSEQIDIKDTHDPLKIGGSNTGVQQSIVLAKEIEVSKQTKKLLASKNNEVESLARAILETGANISPLVLLRTSDITGTKQSNSYKVVDGDFQHAAIIRAKEINPQAGEKTNAFIINSDNKSAILDQIKIAGKQ